MTEFQAQLRDRVATTSRELRDAEDCGDTYTADIMSATLDNLLRIAAEHDVLVPVPGGAPDS